jgi:hypothetical protein
VVALALKLELVGPGITNFGRDALPGTVSIYVLCTPDEQDDTDVTGARGGGITHLPGSNKRRMISPRAVSSYPTIVLEWPEC